VLETDDMLAKLVQDFSSSEKRRATLKELGPRASAMLFLVTECNGGSKTAKGDRRCLSTLESQPKFSESVILCFRTPM
jgi:hypothetical protein